MNHKERVTRSLRKAFATFVFSTTGVLVGFNVMEMDVETWRLVIGTGLGSLINFAYRWAEAEVKKEGI